MAKDNIVKIGGELKSVAADGVVAGAEAIRDYTEGKMQSAINAELRAAIAAVSHLTYVVVPSLPVPSVSTMGKIYLIPSSSTADNNVKDEYITIESGGSYSWEKIGSTSVDLSAYSTTAQMNTAIQNAVSGKQDRLTEQTTGTRVGDLSVKYGINADYGITVGTSEDTMIVVVPGSVRKGINGDNIFDTIASILTSVAAKQDTLTFDNTPTANSNNPVKSSGIKTAVDAKQDTISTVNVTVDNNTGTPSGSASVSGSTLSLNFQNLKGATGAQGPQGIQGVQGVQGPKGDTGVTGDASSLAIIHGIDKTTSYQTTDVCGADAAQALLLEIDGGFYY